MLTNSLKRQSSCQTSPIILSFRFSTWYPFQNDSNWCSSQCQCVQPFCMLNICIDIHEHLLDALCINSCSPEYQMANIIYEHPTFLNVQKVRYGAHQHNRINLPPCIDIVFEQGSYGQKKKKKPLFLIKDWDAVLSTRKDAGRSIIVKNKEKLYKGCSQRWGLTFPFVFAN